MGRILSERDVIGMDAGAPDAEVMNAVRSLLETGVRRICVSFQGAHRTPEQEVRIKKIVEQQYPDHFLGSVPVLAGSDISQSSDDMTRSTARSSMPTRTARWPPRYSRPRTICAKCIATPAHFS